MGTATKASLVTVLVVVWTHACVRTCVCYEDEEQLCREEFLILFSDDLLIGMVKGLDTLMVIRLVGLNVFNTTLGGADERPASSLVMSIMGISSSG